MTYLEIYKETLRDLLKNEFSGKNNPVFKIREKLGQLLKHVTNLTEKKLSSPEDFEKLIK